MSYKEGGWQNKYRIQKYVGQSGCNCREAHCGCWTLSKPIFEDVDPEAVYFVLRLDTDPHARAAAREYARSVKDENPEFAEDILKKIHEGYMKGKEGLKC